MRKKLMLVVVGLFVALGTVLALMFFRIPHSPEEALHQFYSHSGAEDQLMDPLILGGKKVVPLILAEIKNKKMPRRRYAIGALGNIGDRSALGALKEIVSDTTELDYFRCDAFEAIALVDMVVASELAGRYKNDPVHCLSEASRDVTSNKQPARRTFLEALLGSHS